MHHPAGRLSGGASKYLEEVTISWGDDPSGQGASGIAVRTGKIHVVRDIRRARSYKLWRDAAARYGFRTSCALPLEVDGDVIGVLAMYAHEPGAFDSPEIALMTGLASELAYGIGRLRDGQRLERSLDSTIRAIAATTEIRDPFTAGHQRRVSQLAAAIADRLGMDAEEIRGIALAADVHDIGKIAVPAEILTRPGRVSDVEFALIKTHSETGEGILAGIECPWPIASVVRQHHERLDGSGYPDGLRGDEILRGVLIVAVADVVEAMSSHRPYRPALGLAPALEEVRRGAGTRYDQTAVDCCLALFREGFVFEASDDEPAAVPPAPQL